MKDENSSDKRISNLTSILGLYKAEWLNGRLFELFSEPTYFRELETTRPCVLIGGRGTGKTTVLRGLSYQGQFALADKDGSRVSTWPFFGLYYRVNTNRVTAFRGPELTEEKWSAYFAHYINLTFCQLLLEFAAWYELQTESQIAISPIALKKIQKSLGLEGIETLPQLAEEIEYLILDFEASINTIVDSPPRSVSMQAAPIDALAAALIETSQLAGKQFFFLIDEFENFEDYQQRVLNTIIKHANSSYTFKIGVRELGWRQRATLNHNEQLISPADYARINISEVLTSSRFRPFAEQVILSRFAKAAPQMEANGVRIQEVFPELTELDESTLLMDKERPQQLINTLAVSLSASELAKARELHPGVLNFLTYWSNSRQGLTFPDCVRELLAGEGNWPARIQNHFYASLFSIRKGKRGIRKFYSGWDVFLSLANGNIRYLLELVHAAFLIHFEQDGKLFEPISHEAQTKAAAEVGGKNLSELEGLSVDGARLKKLLLSLGRIFQVLADDPAGHTPEVNQFHLIQSDIDEQLADQIRQILDQSVMHLALVRSPGNKLMDESDTREYDYMIHPIFAPFFVFSHRRKRKLSLESSQILRLIESPKEAIRDVLNKNNRADSEPLPDQLQLFGSYYAGN